MIQVLPAAAYAVSAAIADWYEQAAPAASALTPAKGADDRPIEEYCGQALFGTDTLPTPTDTDGLCGTDAARTEHMSDASAVRTSNAASAVRTSTDGSPPAEPWAPKGAAPFHYSFEALRDFPSPQVWNAQ